MDKGILLGQHDGQRVEPVEHDMGMIESPSILPIDKALWADS